jgi:quercetin dioxygenase-like cupin family protein
MGGKVMRKHIVRTRDGANETMNMLGEQFTVLAAGEETGSYEVFVQVVPTGGGPPLHSHAWDEAFYVLDGEIVFSTDAHEMRAPVGTFVHFPADTPHTFASRGGTATILSFTSHPGAAAFFRESYRISSEFPGNLERFFAVPGRHGVCLLESPEHFDSRRKSVGAARLDRP